MINHIIKRQQLRHIFNANGPYSLGTSSTYVDQVMSFPFAWEITAFMYFNGTSGTGTTTVDNHYVLGDATDNGTIWSTKPAITSTAANNTYTMYDQLNTNTIINPTGHTLAVLSKTSFLAGEGVRFDLDASMSGATDFSITFFYRPV